jgi:hypothetical protein
MVTGGQKLIDDAVSSIEGSACSTQSSTGGWLRSVR